MRHFLKEENSKISSFFGGRLILKSVVHFFGPVVFEILRNKLRKNPKLITPFDITFETEQKLPL